MKRASPKVLLQPLEGRLTLLTPLEFLPPFEDFEKGEAPIRCFGNESVKGSSSTYKTLYLHGLAGDLMFSKALISSGFASIPCWLTMYHRNLPEAMSNAHLMDSASCDIFLEWQRHPLGGRCGLRLSSFSWACRLYIHLHSSAKKVREHSVD